MAMTPTYRAGQRTGTAPLARRNVAASAVGNGLSVLGRAGTQAIERSEDVDDQIASSEQRMALAEALRDRQEAAMAHASRLSATEATLAEAIGTLEREPPAGAEGHESAVQALLTEAWQELAGELPDDAELFDRSRAEFDRFASRHVIRAEAWAARYRADQAGEDYQSMLANNGRRLYATPDAEELQAILESQRAYIEAMPYGEDAQARLIEEGRESVVNAMLTGALDQGQFTAIYAVIDDPVFAAAIGDAEDLSRWRARAAAGQRTAEAAAQATANEQERAALEALETIEVRLENGDDVSAAEVNAAMQGAADSGVPEADVLRFGYMAERQVRQSQLHGLPTQALMTEQRRLQGLMGSGAASREDRLAYASIDAVLGARDAEGGASLRDMASADPAAAVEQLAAQDSAARRWGIAAEAGDTRLAAYAGLTPRARGDAIEGRTLRRERPLDFLPEISGRRSAGEDTRERQARASFDAILGADLVYALGGNYGAHFEAAMDLMAGRQQAWSDEGFAQAVNEVMGATRRRSGEWQGGLARIAGNIVELPESWTGEEFERGWRALSFPGAQYTNGSPASAADVRRHFRPVLLERTREQGRGPAIFQYLLIGPDDAPLRSEGRDLVLQVTNNAGFGMRVRPMLGSVANGPSVRVSASE